MKKRLYFLNIHLFIIVSVGFSQKINYNTIDTFLPTSSTGQIINHKFYSLSYSLEHKLSEWVYYALTCEQISGNINRTDDFRPDPLVLNGSSQLIDYSGSGYDRGHLAPAGDMKISSESMSESFYLSNMTPQVPSFNRGIWLELENKVRYWACKDSLIYVVTGPIFTKNDLTIGPNEVTVPSYFYKIVFYKKSNVFEMIGFILHNGGSRMKLNDCIYNVDDIEKITGIDFFYSLPDSIENLTEKRINRQFWDLDN